MSTIRTRWLGLCAILLFMLMGCTDDLDVGVNVFTTYYGYEGRFHMPGCSVIKEVQNSALVGFTSRDDAIAAGFLPCPVCKP
jgi:hypothetical protein